MLMRTASEVGSGTATVTLKVLSTGKESLKKPGLLSSRKNEIGDPSSRVPVNVWFRAVIMSSTPAVPTGTPSRKNSVPIKLVSPKKLSPKVALVSSSSTKTLWKPKSPVLLKSPPLTVIAPALVKSPPTLPPLKLASPPALTRVLAPTKPSAKNAVNAAAGASVAPRYVEGAASEYFKPTSKTATG